MNNVQAIKHFLKTACPRNESHFCDGTGNGEEVESIDPCEFLNKGVCMHPQHPGRRKDEQQAISDSKA